MRTPRTLAALALAATLTLAACGSDDDNDGLDPVEVGGTSATSDAPSPNSPSTDADDVPLSGQVLEDATAAALAEVGEGTVTEATGADADDSHVYEVEIDLPNGEDVTVELDQDFGVVRVDR